MLKYLLLSLLIILFGLVVYQNSVPKNIGVKEGKLSLCPSSPNCATITLPNQPIDLAAVVSSLPRTTIITLQNNYIHAECRSKFCRFIDDLEILITQDHIQIRSASRVGYGDMGVNQARIEKVTAILQE